MTRETTGRSPQAGGERAVMLAWERFLSGDDLPDNAVRRMVEDSWRRCLDTGVSPGRVSAPVVVDEDGMHSLQQRHRDMIEAAKPVMAHARDFLSESGTMMILTDPKGVILWVEGDPGAKFEGQDVKLVPGALWDENASGTNAIGTALASGQPIQICAAEHFCEGVKSWTCSASVIRDPFDGAILGALDISGLSGSHNTHCLALAVAGAGRIEARMAATEMERRARLLDLTFNQSARWSDNGLVVFDRRGRLVRANERAGLFFDSVGLDLSVCNELGAKLALGRSARAPSNLPAWLNADWIEPIRERDELLGSILAIPPSKRWVAQGAAPAADPAASRDPFDRVIGASEAMVKARNRARQLARLQLPVLLLGPTGAGKEVFARALHDAGSQAKGPFVPLNCGSMTRDLLASELFGYAEGAFTGARRGGMTGKFEAAHGGTLFLDEIGEMPLDLQTHLLRVLEDGEVYRVGENKARKVQVRVIAATNRDLRDEVAQGRFRMDLFYRLAVTSLRLPPLADRREDIPVLARHFVQLAATRHKVAVKAIDPPVLEALAAYAWPGNIRELRNVIEGMTLLALGERLTLDDLPPEFWGAPPAAPVETLNAPILRLADRERQTIVAAIEAEHGNLTRVAARLGIAKSTLYEKVKRYGISRVEAQRFKL
ncbi:MAG TPA: sigma-54-dependent Fis family transcriptional regulator [Rhodoblastus sp.]|nr:sigma-54-dependent Fis family transcriptional regulator [Rhodoblastus sp.]